jgi:hypothetical protein
MAVETTTTGTKTTCVSCENLMTRTYAVAPQTIVGAGFFRDFSPVAQSLDQPALTGFFILKCVSCENANS